MENYQEKMIKEIDLRGLAPSTKRAYLRSMNGFVEFCSKVLNEINLEDIKNYLYYFKQKNAAGRKTKMSANCVNREASAVAFFCKNVLNKNYYRDIPRMKVPRRQPVILSQNEILKMVNVLHNGFWKAVLMTLYSTGMRQSELRNLKVSDIDSDRMVFYIRDAKGAKDREAILSSNVLECLRNYWQHYRIDRNSTVKSNYLFIPNKNTYNGVLKKSLSHTAVGYIVKRAAEIAGIKKKFILIV